MEEGGEVEVGGAQVSPATFLPFNKQLLLLPPQQTTTSTMQNSNYHHTQNHPLMNSTYANPNANWDPKLWPLEEDKKKKKKKKKSVEENLALKTGDGLAVDAAAESPPVVRANKRVRSGSPTSNDGNCQYPSCQVDDCKVDLSEAKEYHRRHKVCEAHSKAPEALVGKQKQRFCQQCSRFHLLPEFDEGKRSCRRRLAGHNLRRRKIQHEDALLSSSLPTGNYSINLLSILAYLQGNSVNPTILNPSSSPFDEDQLVGILRRLNSTASRNSTGGDDINPSQNSQHLSNGNVGSSSCPSTMDLLAVLSKDLVALGSSDIIGDGNRTQTIHRNPSSDVNSNDNSNVEVRANGCGKSLDIHVDHPIPDSRLNLSLQLFNDADGNIPSKPKSSVKRLCSESSTPSDHSPASSNSSAEDRTNYIIFKLSEKHPRDIPESLRTQILDWLSHCPSEMESYIRPGCVVLSIYLSMPFQAWKELQEDLLQRLHLLLQCSGSDFWTSGSFLIRIDRKLASSEHGKVHFCESSSDCSPELKSVSPLAIVSGKATHFLLRGRNLTLPGTRIHCTYMGGYLSKEVSSTSCLNFPYDFTSESFIFPERFPYIFGRCFIEVENCLRGNSFPVIIADENICRELRDLESEFEGVGNEDSIQYYGIMHFLNELGWLFQRTNHHHHHHNHTPSDLGHLKDFSSTRFELLLTFSVERDWSGLVAKLLDIFVELRSSGVTDDDGHQVDDFMLLSEIELLSRAVKRKCSKMVEMFLNYSIKISSDRLKVYLFPPNHKGPANITPLHLAASMQDSEDIVDTLTNDPQQIGLKCWNTLMDCKGRTPYAYAESENNHSYNELVARKITDKKNFQHSIAIIDKSEEKPAENSHTTLESNLAGNRGLRPRSCAQCTILESRKLKGANHSKGLLYRPFAYSLLTIAAVCVCVCLLLRGCPEINTVEPFKWKNIGYGPR